MPSTHLNADFSHPYLQRTRPTRGAQAYRLGVAALSHRISTVQLTFRQPVQAACGNMAKE
jgi:hypothetical protein